MLTFYGIILLLSCSLQEGSDEFPVLLLSSEAFIPFAVVLSGRLYLQNQKKTNPMNILLVCETLQPRKWQDIANHMDMSKVA